MATHNSVPRKRAIEVLRAGRVVALVGPGLLACAGLTPPESRGGLWDLYDPTLCATAEALERTPERAWEALGVWLAQTRGAGAAQGGPSAAHRALAALAGAGKLRGVICTTTDGLVRASGVENVAELFGAIDRLRCEGCRARGLVSPEGFEGAPPVCGACGGRLRPDMVLFGEAMPRQPRELAASWVYGGRALLSLGADLTRPPIHRIPEEMFQEGGLTIALGEVEPGVVGRVRGLHLEGEIEALLPSLVEAALA